MSKKLLKLCSGTNIGKGLNNMKLCSAEPLDTSSGSMSTVKYANEFISDDQ